MTTANNKRRFRQRYFCDAEVQTGLLKRMAYYWIACILFLTLPLALIKTVAQPDVFFVDNIKSVFANHWPLLLMLIFFLPFAMNDAVRFSNRFVGPIYRLRTELRAFENGGKFKKIKFRQGDFWQDMLPGLNQLGQRLAELEAEVERLTETQQAKQDSLCGRAPVSPTVMFPRTTATDGSEPPTTASS